MSMEELLLQYLKENKSHPFLDFNSNDLKDVELADFLYWLGKRVDTEENRG